MSFGQLILILKARWKACVAVLLLVTGLVIGVSMILPKQYTSSATLVFDFKPDPVAAMAYSGLMAPGYLATQIDILNSDRVARRVVRSLKLAQNDESRARWREATGGVGDFESWLAESLKRNLDVRPSRESNVLTVGYSGADPRFAAIVANAFVQAYIDTNLEMRVDPAKQYSTFFDVRAKELRDRVEGAQTKLSEFQRAKGLIATDERLDVENARLNELSAQLVMLQGISAESTSRQTQARTAGDTLQDVMANPLVSQLKAELSRQEVRMKELNARLGENHPQVQELRASIAELRVRIDTETRKVTSSVGVTNSINRGREAEVRAALETQRAKVLRMKEQRDEAMVLQREVDNAQRAYDTVLQRLTQTSLESQNTMTNVSVLAPATEPSRPSSPRVVLNGVLAVFFGLLLGIGVALLMELRNRKIRSREDIVEGVGLPLIGVMPGPDKRRLLGGPSTPQLARRVLGQLPSPNAKGA